MNSPPLIKTIPSLTKDLVFCDFLLESHPIKINKTKTKKN